ncbi:peptidylprolyl isomerase [Amorphus sp. 3PC139-8]|uniref:peptidylprolyl isomerase n=1 Tax=Amorphus sp. 3PC139-8 TaxID=2735676 RepID=UPI00345D3EC7
MLRRLLAVAAMALVFALPAAAQSNTNPENILVLETNKGTVEIALRPDLAPAHVERIKTLAREGFYDDVVFHRVIEGFMAQTGDPTGTGAGGSDYPDLKAEFTDTPYERGTVGMARAQSPDSANSQFFIMFNRVPSLDGQYTVFGEVIDGMDVVDSIKKGSKSANGRVSNPDRIVDAYIAADKN